MKLKNMINIENAESEDSSAPHELIINQYDDNYSDDKMPNESFRPVSILDKGGLDINDDDFNYDHRDSINRYTRDEYPNVRMSE